MNESSGGAEILAAYFQETMQGDLTAVDRYFAEDPEYVLIASDNPELAAILPWVGSQSDREGIKQAYGELLSALKVIAGTQDMLIDAGEHVMACGTFTYEAEATGKVVDSDWAVHATVRDGLIRTFHFYEDSYALASVFRVGGEWTIETGRERPRPRPADSE